MSSRDSLILKELERSEVSIAELLEKEEFKISKITLNRDLAALVKQGFVETIGQGKATKYKLTSRYKLLKEVDFAHYFSVHYDDRKVQESFNFEVFSILKDIFTKAEQEKLEELNLQYQKNITDTTDTIYRKELERLIIDLSWKSARLEGNTYDLLDTERLFKDKIEASGHSKQEALMLLNHKYALDFILENKSGFQELSLEKIIEIHKLLVKDLDVSAGLRSKKVGIIGTKYKPLAKQEDIEKALVLMCELVNLTSFPLAKALIVLACISYIQAFEDGNKRSARIIATAILLAFDYCPISYRKVDDYDYKKSILLFYEQNNLYYLKKLLSSQFKFAVQEYF